MSRYYIYIVIVMAICPFLFSQENPDLKQWTKMQCDELKNIHTPGYSSEIWGMESESTQYLLSQYDNIWGKLYKFTANGQKATLKEISTIANVNLYNDEIYYLNNDQDMYQSCRHAGIPDHNNKHRYAWQLTIWSLNVESGAWGKGYFSDFRIESINGQCFLLNNAHYFLSSSDSRLYQLKLTQGGEQGGTIEQVQTYELNYSPKQYTSILLLNDTLYYFSNSGFCAVTISDDGVENFLINSVTTTDEKSSIITDKNNRIWIISEIDGVIEYDIKNNSETKIAEFPSNSLSKDFNLTKACFYSENYLYCITNEAVYSLNLKGSNPNPINPKWIEMQCDELKNIHTDEEYPEIWGMESKSNQYLLSQYNSATGKLYKFTTNGQKATLKEISTIANVNLYNNQIYYLNNDEDMYCLSTYSVWSLTPAKNKKNHNNKHRAIGLLIDKINIKTGEWNQNYKSNFVSDSLKGQCFLLNNTHYFLCSSESYLEQLKLIIDGGFGLILEVKPKYELDYSPQHDTSILVLNDTLYYFSDSGFCAVTISDNSVENFLIDCVTTTDETSSIITDKKNRIWIISETDGVIEYDIKNDSATKIAEFPSNTLSKSVNLTKACFYSQNYLYCITNEAVYSLNLKGSNPVKPRKPRKPWIGPIIPIIEGGYKFTGLAEFFNSYLSIVCNGISKMFSFEPKIHTFYEAPNAPHFDPDNSNNVFTDERYFYIHNPKHKTITCTDTQTGMSQEIACYENMPEDILQIASENNLFYILTESGENHIARKDGFNLKYESTWKLDDWTPRTGASIVAMKNAIYVFGGKALSDSKEESSTCYNELYVYDLTKNASEKLEVDKDVTPRYNATILTNKSRGRLWIICGQDSSDSLALDLWEFNTLNQKWTYINDIPAEGEVTGDYAQEEDTLTILVTPKAEENTLFSMRSKTRNILQASSEAGIYQIKNLSTATSTEDQSGKSCGCLGLEFLFALAGLFILRRFAMRN